MSGKTAARLKSEILAATTKLLCPFTVAELKMAMPNAWPHTTLDRTLAELCEEGALTQVRRHPLRRYVVGLGESSTVADPAPDWSPRYPSGGEQIGPSWQAMWDAMASGEWIDVLDLVRVGEAARGCATATVRTLLFAAARARHIEPEARFDERSRRWRMWYRRPDKVKDRREVGV